jgi:transcriptional regulator GlxA family with amidase domain
MCKNRAAGIDLCLHIVRRDHGTAVAIGVSPMAYRRTFRPLETSRGPEVEA